MNKTHLLAFAAMVGLALAPVGAKAQQVAAPAPVYPIPEKKQVDWQKRETTAFIHFGLNTFADREWGYGDTDPATFNPAHLDCEQWVRTLVAAGMKGVILTAKHHDGFCLWPTRLTDYCIRSTPYKDGKGDIVGELEKACRKYGLEFAVYLSPWDRHQSFYGTPEYVSFYHKQLQELLTTYGRVFEVWFDGANGGDGWYGGAKDKRTIDRKNYYDYPTIYRMIDTYQPSAVIFGDGGPGCRWVGNEKGFAGETNWSFLRSNTVYPGYPQYKELQYGHADGDQWTAAECDVSIRPGWFWHEQENGKVKTPAELTDLYYRSVGHNALLLLNIPVNSDGLISPQDSINAIAFHENIKAELANDLLSGMTAQVSGCRGRGYTAGHLTDGIYDTYWATADGESTGTVTFKFKKKQKVNRLMIQEYIPLGQRVKKFTVLAEQNGKMQPVDVGEETTTVGYKRLLRFPTVETRRIAVRFDEARGPLCINRIGAFFADTPVAREMALLGGVEMPASLPYTVTTAVEGDAAALADRNPATTCRAAGPRFTLDLGEVKDITTLCYLPDQSDAATGFVSNYRVLVAEQEGETPREVAAGEFSNIRNNPVMQTVSLGKTRARYVTLEATRMVTDGEQPAAAQLIVH